MADQDKPAFYPRVGNIRPKKQVSPLQQVIQRNMEELSRGPEFPQWGDMDLSVPTSANRQMSQRLVDEDLRQKQQALSNLSPLERLAAGMQAARVAGSGLVQGIASMPTELMQGPEAAQKQVMEGMYKPTMPQAYDYLEEALDPINKAVEAAKLSGLMPEVATIGMIPRELVSAQARSLMGRGIKKAENAVTPFVNRTMEQGGKGAELLGALTQGSRSNVIKPKGGNWLTGSVEKAVDPLIAKGMINNREIPYGPDFDIAIRKRIEDLKQQASQPGYQGGAERAAEHLERDLQNPRTNEAALNNWISRNLTNYIKKEMATPEDPVRKLAEEGVTHLPAGTPMPRNMSSVWATREEAGFPAAMGTSREAQVWEALADKPVGFGTAGEMINIGKGEPWMEKVDPFTRVHGIAPMESSGVARDLGFDHIIDVLKEDLATGRIRPEQLNKVSMEQAVRRTYEYDQELAKKMADARAAAREGLPVHKEYPEGYKWVELNKPGAFATESEAMGHSVRGYEPPKGHADWMEGSGDAGNLGYGHGGWEAIKSGKAKVYSLVDPKGNPHVTVEVASGRHPIGYSFKGKSTDLPETFEYNRDFSGEYKRLTEDEKNAVLNRAKQIYTANPKMERMDAFQQASDEVIGRLPSEITQIKGKQNAAPKPEYLPFVQDFVRGGQWSDVRDIQNTGLIKSRNNEYITEAEAKEKFAPRIKQALEFLQTHPAFEEQRAARLKRDKELLDMDFDRQRELERIYGAPIVPGSPYSATELTNIIQSPEENISGLSDWYPSLNRWLEEAEKGMHHYGHTPPPEGMKRGGKVHISDNPDTQMMAVEEQKFGVGGAAVRRVLGIKDHAERAVMAQNLLVKMAKEGQVDPDMQRALLKAQSGPRALPTVLPRAKPKTKEEIREYAQRTAEQMNAAKAGEFLRADPEGPSINAAGKSKSQWDMEQGLKHDIRPLGLPLDPIQVSNIEDQLGMLKMGITGDTSISDQVLHRAGMYDLPRPSEQQGGPLYGLRKRNIPMSWASNVPVLENVAKDVNEFSRAYGNVPVIGQYNSMGPQGTNFAQHFADANLEAIDITKMTPEQVEKTNDLIRKGNEKSGPVPDFPGIEDPSGAYFFFSFYPELRKHFNAIMTKPDYTKALGLPDGRVILHAITEPELRDMPVLTSGKAQYQLVPGQDPNQLPLSSHSTYTHDLPRDPKAPVMRTPYPVPAEFEFSDVVEYAKPRYKPQEMTRVLQTAAPRQIIDQQHIDEIKMYEEMMKHYTGKKKGGQIKKAEGGEITADDLILEERKL